MAVPIIVPAPQFSDANGHPYAAGTITTYVVGTDEPKDTWLDPEQSALQTNPIVLDAAGRCVMFGDGNYRLVLRDADGNLIWDQPSSTIVSAAMAPVVAAPTIADALDLLGVSDLIQAETDRATAAETTLTNNLNAEITRAEGAEATLTTNLDNEITRAQAAEAHLQDQIDAGTVPSVQGGYGSTNSAGAATITFGTAFTGTPAVVASIVGVTGFISVVGPSSTEFEVFTWTAAAPTGAPANFSWIASGST